jgi:hypothetical protein
MVLIPTKSTPSNKYREIDEGGGNDIPTPSKRLKWVVIRNSNPFDDRKWPAEFEAERPAVARSGTLPF